MKFNRLSTFTLGVVITAVSVGAVSFVNAAGDATIKACADKKTGVMRYIAKGKCKKTESMLSWNQMGPQGLPGSAGTNGLSGTKGDTGPAGPPSPTGFTARSVCGSNGATLCTVGAQGPGGGTIFFIDTANEIVEYDYLETAPDNACLYTCTWSTTTLKCGTTGDQDCQDSFISNAGSALNYVRIGTGNAATSAIVARHQAGGVTKNLYAAGAADSYTTSKASDWWLPSKDELNELCKFARQQSTGDLSTRCSSTGTLRDGFMSDSYWSASEGSWADASLQDFSDGSQFIDTKSNNFTFLVRPIRGF
jgi:hypothetical protein